MSDENDLGPPGNEGGPGVPAEAHPALSNPYTDKTHTTALTSSQQVSFWSVHEHVNPTLVPREQQAPKRERREKSA